MLSLGVALCSALFAACGDGDHLVPTARPVPASDSGVDVPELPGEEDDASATTPQTRPDAGSGGGDAGSEKDGGPQTRLAPVEAALSGETTTARSGRYTMTSRLGAPLGAGIAGQGTSYQITTGVIALQGAQP